MRRPDEEPPRSDGSVGVGSKCRRRLVSRPISGLARRLAVPGGSRYKGRGGGNWLGLAPAWLCAGLAPATEYAGVL